MSNSTRGRGLGFEVTGYSGRESQDSECRGISFIPE